MLGKKKKKREMPGVVYYGVERVGAEPTERPGLPPPRESNGEKRQTPSQAKVEKGKGAMEWQ